MKPLQALSLLLIVSIFGTAFAEARPLKLHAIFTDHMVLQRDKPITVWGWADAGDRITVILGAEQQTAEAAGEAGRWAVTFPARPASADPVMLKVTTGDEAVVLSDILVGDVWVAHGQSNMAWALEKTTHADFEKAQADLPLLRHFRIQTNEQSELATDIPADQIVNGGWEVSSPETAGGFSAIGYVFGARVQRATGVPIGIISNARGGASIESMVPGHKFAEHPLAARYKAHVDERVAAFDHRAKALEVWERQLARAKSRNLPEDKWPKKPEGHENLRSWDIPGKSPSDAASIYNGMFGVLKGLEIKGVLFHQGYNNAMSSNCRPKRYRVLMKLMVQGWREAFDQPDLPVAVIGFCAGGDRQNEDNFEQIDFGGAAYIREAQRLGLADVGDPENLAFLPAYDVQIPGLHPWKKAEHGNRAARWALNRVYGMEVNWDTASLVSAQVQSDVMVLQFDKPVYPDDWGTIPRGFAIAGADGRYYRAHARFATKDRQNRFTNARQYDTTTIHIWSPLVDEPAAVRYGWAVSPEGNLKVNGHPSLPLPSFRTDAWDWPESEDPAEIGVGRSEQNERKADAQARLEQRQRVEAERGIEVLERLRVLGRPAAATE